MMFQNTSRLLLGEVPSNTGISIWLFIIFIIFLLIVIVSAIRSRK